MDQALWIAKTGLEAQQTRMAVTANNLANVNTTGFKRSRAVFEDLLYQNNGQAGAQSSEDTVLNSGLMTGTGVRVVATEKLFSQGSLVQTGNNLDMAIEGRGFFQILMPDGTLGYSRDGTFQMNAQGEIVTAKGYALQPGITIPEDAQSITISTDGIVSVSQPGNSVPTQVGTIQLIGFYQPCRLAAGWPEPVPGDRLKQCAADRNARAIRYRRAGAGGAGDLQCQHRRGTGEHDRDPARL